MWLSGTKKKELLIKYQVFVCAHAHVIDIFTD
jgi:hypothetical protein